jgi:hypothetical protein
MSDETESGQNEGHESVRNNLMCRLAGNVLAGGVCGYTFGGVIAVLSVNRGMPERHILQLGTVGLGIALGVVLTKGLYCKRR